MTETISAAGSRAAESPHLPRPETDAAALRAIQEATAHVVEDMPGRQRQIQDCVDKILAKVDPAAAAS
jgi:hypothetical protein